MSPWSGTGCMLTVQSGNIRVGGEDMVLDKRVLHAVWRRVEHAIGEGHQGVVCHRKHRQSWCATHEVKKHISSRVSSQRRHRSTDFEPWPPRARVGRMEEHPINRSWTEAPDTPGRRRRCSSCWPWQRSSRERKEEAMKVENRPGGT
jgi:hypothetical protein